MVLNNLPIFQATLASVLLIFAVTNPFEFSKSVDYKEAKVAVIELKNPIPPQHHPIQVQQLDNVDTEITPFHDASSAVTARPNPLYPAK
jgi:hypothetical protein